MAQTHKVLGQAALAATTETTIYTTPAATSTIVSTVTVCNRSATATTYRLYVAVAGAGADNKQYIAYDAPLNGNDGVCLSLGITLAATDLLKAYAGAATVTVQAFGVEIT